MLNFPDFRGYSESHYRLFIRYDAETGEPFQNLGTRGVGVIFAEAGELNVDEG
jgi:hypothetical protein